MFTLPADFCANLSDMCSLAGSNEDVDVADIAARGGRRVWIYSSRVPDRNASTPPCSLAVSSSLCTRNAAADKTPLPLPVFPRAAAKLSRLFGRVCAGEDG
eukprot:24743-Pelagococcus_subviridis.AAC.1